MIAHSDTPYEALPLALGKVVSAVHAHKRTAQILHLLNDEVQFGTQAELLDLSKLCDQVVYFDVCVCTIHILLTLVNELTYKRISRVVVSLKFPLNA